MNTGNDRLKPSEIADLAGLSEEEVRGYIAAYPALFPYRSIGPVRLYAAKAVETVKKCAESARAGRDVSETAAAIAADETEEDEPAPLSPVTQAYLEARDLKDLVARQEQQIEALRRQTEEREGTLLARITALEEAMVREQKKTSLVAEWIDYFDAEIALLKRPLLKRIFGKKN